MLLGILDILDPELFLRSCEQECREPQVELVGGGHPVPGPALATLGSPSVKLEALNELIHFDHIYTKPVEVASDGRSSSDSESEAEKIDEASYHVAEVVVVEEEETMTTTTVCVKDEPQEVVIAGRNGQSQVDDLFSRDSSPALSGLDKEASLVDAYSDSGYERSPSPFSNMSSPLCAESSWDDVFANELFPQLISV